MLEVLCSELGSAVKKWYLGHPYSQFTPTFSGSVEGRVEGHSMAIVFPQHLSIDLIGTRVYSQHQVQLRPKALGDAPEALLEVGPELGCPPWVWLKQALQPGPDPRLQGQGSAELAQLNILHQLLPALLGDGDKIRSLYCRLRCYFSPS